MTHSATTPSIAIDGGRSRAALYSWIAGLPDTDPAPGTARIRQLAVRRFATWLTARR